MIHDRRSENRQQEETPRDFHAGPKTHGNEMLLTPMAGPSSYIAQNTNIMINSRISTS